MKLLRLALIAALIPQLALAAPGVTITGTSGNQADVDGSGDLKTTATISGGVTANSSAKATAAAPSYTDGTTDPVSQDLAGNQRVIVVPALPAGTNILGKVGIDQTTPGTTNGVQVNAALPAGANTIGNVGLVAGSALIGNVGVAQGSTTSGQSGPLVQGAVTTSPPSYTTGQTAPISLDVNGNVRVTAPASSPVNVTVTTPPNDVQAGPFNITGASDVPLVNTQGSGANGVQITGTFTGLAAVFQASIDGTNYVNVGAYNANTGAIITAGTSITATGIYVLPAAGYRFQRLHVTAVSTGTAVVTLNSSAGALDPPNSVASGGKNVNATNFPSTVDTNNGAAGASTVRIAASDDTHSQCSALCANLVVKASAGVLKSFEVSADSTLSGSTWYVMVYDAASAPSDGAVTPAKCYQQASGVAQMGGVFNSGGVAFTTGIVIGVSTTGCFNKTASTHAFIAADNQ